MSLSGDFDDSDDYVAKLLVEDARKSSMRYASQGLSALLPKRPTGTAPKPNTRFLKTLVREADNHNAKLKEKEEFEARTRLRKFRDAEQASATRHGREREKEGRYDRERKRRRLSDDNEDPKGTWRAERERAQDSRRSRSPERRRRQRRRQRDTTEEADEDQGHKRSRHHKYSRRTRSRSRSRSRSRERNGRERHKSDGQQHRHERKSRRDSLPSDLEPEEQKDVRDGTRAPSISSTSSDPLSSHIGPRPPSPDQRPRRRGRGFHNPSRHARSNIDTHFSPTYNPAAHDPGLDPDALNLEDEEGDQDEWTSALSALRDRRAWRAKQAERMKDAGFSEEEIKRWEKSSSTSRTLLAGGDDEGDVRDVRWRKKGEEREWDVGKERSLREVGDDGGGGGHYHHGIFDKPKMPAREGNVKNEEKTSTGVDSAWRRPDNAFLKQFKSALR